MPENLASGVSMIHPNNQAVNIPQVDYSDAAKKHINFRRQRLIAARDAREQPRPEFDDMTFSQFYEVLKKADDQYVAPRKNKSDTSINTGTIRDKDTTLVEYAMKYDFEPVAQVFDDNDEMLEEMAETGEDLVRKSLMLEDMRAKSKLIYRSMVAFGTALVEDYWLERWVLEKQLGTGKIGALNTEWTEKKVKEYDGCQAKLWDLRKCYFGDIKKFFMNGPQGQPYFFTVEYESIDVLETMFGDWERWVNVPRTLTVTPEIQNATMYSQGWTLNAVTSNVGEVIRYYDPIAKEFALTINGVDMLPIMDKKIMVNGIEKQLVSGFPLTAVSPSGVIPFAKYDFEPMHDFAYSKAQPAKMRVWGDVENMFVKTMIQMMKQKAKPTMGNKSGRTLGDEVHDSGTVIPDLRDGDLFPILPNYRGLETADFSMFELVKKELDKNSVDRTFQGTDSGGATTATENMNDMKAQSLKVAAVFDGITFGNQQLYWLRTYNIAKNWTKPIDTSIDTLKNQLVMKYRTVNVPTEIEGGQKATKKIVFTKTPPTGDSPRAMSETVHQQEVDHKKEGRGSEMRIAYLNPEIFAMMKMSWFYRSIPVPNDSDPLSYVLFAKQIQDAIAFFGPESLNVKKLKHRFSSITGNDYDTWFLNEQELEQKQQAMANAAAATGVDPAAKLPGQQTKSGQPTMAGAVQNKAPSLQMK